MTEYLVLRPGEPGQPSQWLLVDSTAGRYGRVSTGPLEQAARDAGGRPVVVLVPALDVLTTHVRIPARSQTKIRAALPFALEESLAQDIDEMHFALGTRDRDGHIPVVVTEKARLNEWLERLEQAGITPAKMQCESEALAVIPGTMSILLEGSMALFNDGGQMTFATENLKPSDVLVAAGQLGEADAGDDDQRSRHLLVYCDAEHKTQLEHDWIALQHELSSVDVKLLKDGALPLLALTAVKSPGVNLLQGEYGKTAEYSTALRPWKTAAILLLGLAVAGLTAQGVDYWRLANERDALRQQFTTEYRRIRPGDARDIVDPLSTVASLRRSAGNNSAPPVFLQSLNALAAAVAGSEGTNIEAITYRAGVVDIRLVAPDVETLDEIQQNVSSTGQFRASIQSADQVGDGVNGRIQVREAGS